MVVVDPALLARALCDRLLQSTVVHPSEEVAAILHRPFEEIDLGAQTMVRGQH